MSSKKGKIANKKFINIFLVTGIKIRKPITSVMKPGNINSIAANAIDAPEINS